MGRIKRVQGNARCEVCGNNDDVCFEIRLGGERHIFDSFECAMRAFTPRCEYCGSQIVGHGVLLGNVVYCSYQCANDYSAQQYQARIHSAERADF
jgi:hypothetical protein